MTENFSGTPETGGIHSGTESDCRRIFLEGNLTVNELCAGDEVRNLRTLSSFFHVQITARENMLSLSGPRENMEKVNAFLPT